MIEIGVAGEMDREAIFHQFEKRPKVWQPDINEHEPRLKTSLAKNLI
ncbi:hypothetical protein KBI33_02050 [Candidatus Shapirobacteria bacterium]|nr:hypothetical protein [Candidatus Shapirobacteria bacterium]